MTVSSTPEVDGCVGAHSSFGFHHPQLACHAESNCSCFMVRFKDGTRVKCRVLPSLPTHRHQGGSKRRSRKGLAVASNSNSNGTVNGTVNTNAPEDANAGPVELSLRESRLDESVEVSEATKREGPPEVGSTAKVGMVGVRGFAPTLRAHVFCVDRQYTTRLDTRHLC